MRCHLLRKLDRDVILFACFALQDDGEFPDSKKLARQAIADREDLTGRDHAPSVTQSVAAWAYSWNIINEMAQEDNLSMEYAERFKSACRDLLDTLPASEDVETFLEFDGVVLQLKNLLSRVASRAPEPKETWMTLPGFCSGSRPLAWSDAVSSAAESLSLVLSHLIRSGDSARAQMEELWPAMFYFVDRFHDLNPTLTKEAFELGEADSASFLILYHLLRRTNVRDHMNQPSTDARSVEEIFDSLLHELQRRQFYLIDEASVTTVPIPLVLRGCHRDYYIPDIELTQYIYPCLSALLAAYEQHADKETALAYIGTYRRVLLRTAALFAHGLQQGHCDNALDPEPSILLPKVLELIELACNPTRMKELDDDWEDRDAVLLMQVAAEVRISSGHATPSRKRFAPYPSVLSAVLHVLQTCTPKGLWQHMLIDAPCVSATSFMTWLCTWIAPNSTEEETRFLVHVLASTGRDLKVNANIYQMFQSHAVQSPAHQALMDWIRPMEVDACRCSFSPCKCFQMASK